MGFFTHHNCVKMRVWGGQGSPQGPDEQCGPAKTPGSSMKSRFQAQAATRSVISGAFFWIALLAVLAVFSLSSVALRAQSATAFFKHGQAAEAKEDYDGAFDNYQNAHAKTT